MEEECHFIGYDLSPKNSLNFSSNTFVNSSDYFFFEKLLGCIVCLIFSVFIEGGIEPLFPHECYFENQNSNLYFYRHSALIFLRESSLQRRTLFKNITSFPTLRRLCIKIYQWAIKNTLLRNCTKVYGISIDRFHFVITSRGRTARDRCRLIKNANFRPTGGIRVLAKGKTHGSG